MTPRRASAFGASFRRQLAAVRFVGPAAALVTATLWLPAATLRAGTHSTHPRHTSVERGYTESSGKAPAHVVRDTGARSSHAAALSASRQPSRSPRSSTPGKSRTSSPASAPSSRSRKSSPGPKHASQPHSDASGKHSSGAHSGRKRRQQQPIDDPQPVFRARNERGRGSRADDVRAGNSSAHKLANAARVGRTVRYVPESHTAASRYIGRPAADAPRRQLRSAHEATAEPLRSPAAPGGLTNGVVQALAVPHDVAVSSALSKSAQPTQAIEGFGAEVDFHAPPAQAARAPASASARETPAEQERDLRAAADIASQPMFVPLFARDGNLIVPPPLKGSRDILIHQNQMADDAGLARIQDDADLNRLRRARLLVDFPESASLRVNEGLPENRRSARPWTVKFATDTARAFYAHFGDPLQVNSAVRTVAYQLRLQRTNGNAAAVDGEGASPHLTGQAIDFGKRGMSVAEIGWMRSYLLPLIEAGKIDVEEEFQQACFHISVYASYAPASHIHAPGRTEVAQVSKAAHTRSAGESDDNLR